MQPTIPQDVAFLLPLAGAGLTRYLSSDRLAQWQNALIALIFLLLAALGCVWLSGTFLLASPQASVLAILGYVVLLMNGSLKTIMLYVQSIPSPFDGHAPVNVNPVRVPVMPTALPLPTPTSVPAAPSQEPPK
ncbi:MAG: hypothetical protein ACRDHZ_00705 [Ktedonobacteraceae bacterium]